MTDPRRGVALLTALAILVVVGGISALMFARTLSEIRHSGDDTGIVQSLMLARGAANLSGGVLQGPVRAALNDIVADESSTTERWSFGTGNATSTSPNASTVSRVLSTNADSVASQLQDETDDLLCDEAIPGLADGGDVALRVYFTETACGLALPDGVDLPVGRFIEGSPRDGSGGVSDQTYALPFVVVAEGAVGGYRRNVVTSGEYQFVVGRRSFAQYALFTNVHRTGGGSSGSEIWFTDNTLFDGPVHTNQQFRFYRDPWFGGALDERRVQQPRPDLVLVRFGQRWRLLLRRRLPHVGSDDADRDRALVHQRLRDARAADARGRRVELRLRPAAAELERPARGGGRFRHPVRPRPDLAHAVGGHPVRFGAAGPGRRPGGRQRRSHAPADRGVLHRRPVVRPHPLRPVDLRGGRRPPAAVPRVLSPTASSEATCSDLTWTATGTDLQRRRPRGRRHRPVPRPRPVAVLVHRPGHRAAGARQLRADHGDQRRRHLDHRRPQVRGRPVRGLARAGGQLDRRRRLLQPGRCEHPGRVQPGGRRRDRAQQLRGHGQQRTGERDDPRRPDELERRRRRRGLQLRLVARERQPDRRHHRVLLRRVRHLQRQQRHHEHGVQPCVHLRSADGGGARAARTSRRSARTACATSWSSPSGSANRSSKPSPTERRVRRGTRSPAARFLGGSRRARRSRGPGLGTLGP